MEIKKHPELISALTHALGALLAVAALVLLVVLAARSGSAVQVVGFAIFGAGLILLYTTSSLFHFLPPAHRAKELWQRLDHSLIYILIAASYTPLTLMLKNRGWGWALFGVIWGLCALGVIIKANNLKIPRGFSLLHYLAMGWLVVIAIKPLLNTFSPYHLMWLALGGLAYSLGIFFYAQGKRWAPINAHDIFHLFVIAGSFSHFWFMKTTIGVI